MALYFRTALAASSELLLLFLLGGLAPMGAKDGEHSFSETLAGGFLIYCAALELTAFPLTWARASLYIIFSVWAVVLSLLCAASAVLHLKGFFREVRAYSRRVRFTLAEFVMVLFAAVLIIYAVLHNTAPDMGGTISQMMTDISHDSPGLLDGIYGEPLTAFSTEALLARWIFGGEFFAVLFNIPCLTQMKVVQQGITMVLSFMIIHRVFFRLTGGKRIAAAAATTVAMLSAFTSRTAFSAAHLLFEAGWTGNAVAVNVLLPAVLLLFMALSENPDRTELHILGMCAGLSAVSFSLSAAFLIPVSIVCSAIPVVLSRRAPGLVMHAFLWTIMPLSAGIVSMMHPSIPF